MDIWTILTIVSIPPTVAYYGVKWHRARLAKRREEIVRRVQTGIPLERAVYRLREKEQAVVVPPLDVTEVEYYLRDMKREPFSIYREADGPQSGSGSSY